MGTVISLKLAKELKATENEDMAYQARILAMDKLALLEEMIQFQQQRTRLGILTPSMMKRGQFLFRALEKTAETREMKILTRSYRRHLEHELSQYLEGHYINSTTTN